MNVLGLKGNIFIKLVLIVIFLLVQSCSNTVIGNKLEESFESGDPQNFDRDITQVNSKERIDVKKLKRIKSDQNIILREKSKVQLEKDNLKRIIKQFETLIEDLKSEVYSDKDSYVHPWDEHMKNTPRIINTEDDDGYAD